MSTAEDKTKSKEESSAPKEKMVIERDKNTDPVMDKMVKQFGQDALVQKDRKKGGNLALSPNSDSDDDEPHEGESPEDAKKRRAAKKGKDQKKETNSEVIQLYSEDPSK